MEMAYINRAIIGVSVLLVITLIALVIQHRKNQLTITKLKKQIAELQHDLQTPLVSISANIHSFKQNMPKLMFVYEQATEQKKVPEQHLIPQQTVHLMKQSLVFLESSLKEVLSLLKFQLS